MLGYGGTITAQCLQGGDDFFLAPIEAPLNPRLRRIADLIGQAEMGDNVVLEHAGDALDDDVSLLARSHGGAGEQAQADGERFGSAVATSCVAGGCAKNGPRTEHA